MKNTEQTAENEELIWNFLEERIANPFGVAGLMGNLYAESALNPRNLQQTFERSLGFTDDSYTAAVDDASYNNFATDGAGYGLAQWTFRTRKAALMNYAHAQRASIGNLSMQLGFLWQEISCSYPGVASALKTAESVREASDVVLTKYEQPANQGDSVKKLRASYGQKYYDRYAVKAKEETDMKRYNTVDECPKWARKPLQILIDKGYLRGRDNGQLDLSDDMIRVLIICGRMRGVLK